MIESSMRIFSIVRKIPKGKVASYGRVARLAKTSPRAVGQIMKRNPFAPKVPCHRVICSDGKIGGFNGSNKKNIQKKINLLRKEGVKLKTTGLEKNFSIESLVLALSYTNFFDIKEFFYDVCKFF